MPDYAPPLAVAQQRPRHFNPHGKIRLNFQGKSGVICRIVFFAFSVYGGKYLLISPLIAPAKSPLTPLC